MLQVIERENKISKITTSAIVLIFAFFLIKNPPNMIISWDVFGYYLYLPSFFLHHDVGIKDFSFVQHILDTYSPTGTFYQAAQTANGYWVNKYSMGMAVLYLPAFFAGHIVATVFGFAADGLSAPYQVAITIWSFIVSVIGVIYLRKVLLQFFSDALTTLVLVLICMGTNYFQNVVYSGSMPHNYLFTLYALLLWVTIQWHKNRQKRYAVLIGLICGIATLSRPSELISILIPILWGIKDRATLLEKISLLKSNWLHFVVAASVACLVCLPQLLYWKMTVGKLFYNSYNNPGEGFEFLHPYTWNVLFSFRKGWFIYTPLMLFAVFGFYFLRKRNDAIFFSLFLFFVLNLYIVSSWSCWWYADSFSQRALVQSYPLLALPLGYFIQWIGEQKRFIIYLFVLLFLFLTALNLFQTWQVFHGIIHSSRMTKEYYFAVYGKTKVNEHDLKKLLVSRSYSSIEIFSDSADYKRISKDVMDFEEAQNEPWISHLDTTFSHSGRYSFKLDSTVIFSPNFIRKYSTLTDKDHVWIRFSAWVYPIKQVNENVFTIIASMRHKGWDYKYNGAEFRTQNILPNQWNKIHFDYLTPEIRNVNDSLVSYFWLQGKYPVYLDDYKMEVFEKK